MGDLFVQSNALLSDCGTYRYLLERRWEQKPCDCWVMLNPSTADASEDDPTIRRCMSFSRDRGAGGILVCNLFALRSTDPDALKSHADPVGPENDDHILDAVSMCERVILAWGAHPAIAGRWQAVTKLLRDRGFSPTCLGVTKDGYPKHPLYVARATDLVPYTRFE